MKLKERENVSKREGEREREVKLPYFTIKIDFFDDDLTLFDN